VVIVNDPNCLWCGDHRRRPGSDFCSDGCLFFWKEEQRHEVWEAQTEREFNDDPRNW
jgi:hypothetical protein